MFKSINVLDAKGRPLRDRKTGKLVSRRIKMSEDEIAAFEAERSASNLPEEDENP